MAGPWEKYAQSADAMAQAMAGTPAATATRALGQEARDFASGKNALDYQTMVAAANGDPEARQRVAEASNQIAMGSIQGVGGGKGSKAGSLAMDEASRMARAKEMGFDTGKTWYHGTGSDVEAFDPSLLGSNTTGPSKKIGIHLASDPQLANEYARENVPVSHKRRVIAADEAVDRAAAGLKEIKKTHGPNEADWPESAVAEKRNLIADIIERNDAVDRSSKLLDGVDPDKGANVLATHLAMKRPYIIDADGGMITSDLSELALKAKNSGKYDGVIFKNAFDTPGPFTAGKPLPKPSDVAVVFEPSQIRSKFAAFDPKKKVSGNLSAALGAATIGAGAAVAGSGGDARADDSIPMQGPDGVTRMIPRNLKGEAIASGGKVVQ